MRKIFLGIMLIGAIFIFGCGNKDNNTTTVKKDSGNSSMTDLTPNSRIDNTRTEDSTKVKSGLSEDFTDDMNKMMKDMLDYKFTGDVDLDQANLWIKHHQGGIDLLDDYISEAKDSSMKALAQHMLVMHKAEISDLENWTKNRKPNAAGFQNSEEFKKKSIDLIKSLKLPTDNNNSNPDKLFALYMIPHHKQAVDLLMAYSTAGKDEKLKKKAQTAIKDANKEIEEMQKLSGK